MSFVEHLEELRRRLIWSVVFIGAAFGLCWIGAGDLYEFASAPIRANPAVTLSVSRPQDIVGLHVKVTLVAFAVPLGAIRARPGVVVHLARPLSARAPIRGAVRAIAFPTPLRFLLAKLKYAAFVCVVLAAILTPTTDPGTMLVLAGPMIVPLLRWHRRRVDVRARARRPTELIVRRSLSIAFVRRSCVVRRRRRTFERRTAATGFRGGRG